MREGPPADPPLARPTRASAAPCRVLAAGLRPARVLRARGPLLPLCLLHLLTQVLLVPLLLRLNEPRVAPLLLRAVEPPAAVLHLRVLHLQLAVAEHLAVHLLHELVAAREVLVGQNHGASKVAQLVALHARRDREGAELLEELRQVKLRRGAVHIADEHLRADFVQRHRDARRLHTGLAQRQFTGRVGDAHDAAEELHRRVLERLVAVLGVLRAEVVYEAGGLPLRLAGSREDGRPHNGVDGAELRAQLMYDHLVALLRQIGQHHAAEVLSFVGSHVTTDNYENNQCI
ncbi:splicing factor 3B subunit 4 [Strigomonas culicis]|uniref:Splicing factor 3B subunit 4 n=1 Tax=Strigomonas culicis TaxID=28005 RepID=S9W337_9TRYP|nr:splicing factor 3B subunit 4 [Strigomonas culicis]EPY30245.1 splicing factor 3B subunit 4 [Strigomonas culicis]|eukprot:EPY29503.1 splicing factor 3B subunit 4 [Strigomonas culicis]